MSSETRRSAGQAGTVFAIAADIMALILGLWILMYLMDADRANSFVEFVHDAATWLAGWSYDHGGLGVSPREHSTFDEQWARVVAGYGLAAVVYLFVGHSLSRVGRR